MLCSESIHYYLRSRVAAGLSRGYVHRVHRVLSQFVRAVPVAKVVDLEPSMVTDYLSDRLRQCKPGTVAGDRAVILAWINWLVLEGEVPNLQWPRRIQRIKQPRPLTRALTPEQARQFLVTAEVGMCHRTALARVRDYAMVCVLMDTGLRESELLSLHLADLELEHCCIRVRHGKGDRERIVLFGTDTQEALRQYLRVRRRHGDANCPWLWLTRHGSRPSRSLILHIITKIGWACGLDVTVHELRHTCATSMLRAGMPLPLVARQLGHSQLRSSERYLHLDDSDLRAAYESASPVTRSLNL